MTTIISKEAISNSGFSLDNLGAWGLAAVTSVGGMIVSHVALKAIKKQDSIYATGSVALAGIAGAMFLKPSWAKILSLGVAGYGLLRSANIIVKEISAPADSGAAGLSGFLPETIKAKIRSFLPSLGAVSETLLGDDDLSGMPNLDDVAGIEDVGYVDVSEQKSIGSML